MKKSLKQHLIDGNKTDYKNTVYMLKNAAEVLVTESGVHNTLQLKRIEDTIAELRLIEAEGQKLKSISEEEINNALFAEH